MKHLLIFIAFFCSPTLMYSQEVFVSAGDSKGNNDLTIDYSIGQIFYQSFPDSDYSGVRSYYKEGVHQVYYVDSNVRRLNFDIVTYTYPNPTKGVFNIQLDLDASDFAGLSYSIHSPQGQLIRSGEVKTNPFSIDITDFSSGVYFVYLYSNLNETKLIKIIKN